MGICSCMPIAAEGPLTPAPVKGKALFIVFENFEYLETLVPALRLREEGYAVVMASRETGSVKGGCNLQLNISLPFERVVADQYDCIIIPGGATAGYPAAQDLDNPEVARIVVEFQKTGRPIAAICMGVGILAKTGALKGIKATCDTSTVAVVKANGGDFSNEPVVKSAAFITARAWPDLAPFCQALIEALRRARPILMITGPGFEDIHVRGAFYRVREEGYSIALVSPDPALWKGKAKLDDRGILIGRHDFTTWGMPEKLAVVNPSGYSGLFIPGGAQAVAVLKSQPQVTAAVRAFMEKGLPIGAVGEGVEVIRAADRSVAVADLSHRVVVNRKVVTALDTADLPELWSRFLESMKGPSGPLPGDIIDGP